MPTVSLTEPTCSIPTGTITVTAPLGGAYSYSIGGAYQSSPVFSGLSSGTYNVTVKNSVGCISTAAAAVVNGRPEGCTSNAGIFHTPATCEDFQNGGNGYQLDQLCYSYKFNRVTNVTPGQFFYYTEVTAPSSSFCVDVVQTKSCRGFFYFAIQQGNQIVLWDASCTKAATGTQVSLDNGSICITNAVPGMKYVLSVKYNSKSVIGSPIIGSAPSCTYTFASYINGNLVANSSTSIRMVPNCGVSLVDRPTLDITQPTCLIETGTITVTSPLGVGNTYSIDGTNYQFGTSFSNLAAGTYNITVKNANGTISLATIAVITEQPDSPAAPTVSLTQPTCSTATGIIRVTSPLGEEYTYSIGGTYQSNPEFSDLSVGTYSVTVKNVSGCVSAETAALITAQPGSLVAPSVSLVQPTCLVATGTISVTAPTEAGYTYSIDGANYQSGTLFSHLPAGTYRVTVKSGVGCVSAATAAVITVQPKSCNLSAGIFHTPATCTDFQNGGNGYQLDRLCYSFSNNRVANVTPGQFFYYTAITAPSSSFCVDVVQTKSYEGFLHYAIQQGDQIVLWNASCTKAATGTQVSVDNGSICITNAVPGMQYVLSVKYDSKSVIGSPFMGSAPSATYTFASYINGNLVANSTTSIDMVPNCGSLPILPERQSSGRKTTVANQDLKVSLYPNPLVSSDDFKLVIKPVTEEKVSIKVMDTKGRIISVLNVLPNQVVRFGKELGNGMYFIEVMQGKNRKVIKAQKL